MDSARSTSAKGRRSQATRRKHIPVRTCIACGRRDAKREYVRLVRTPDGRVEVDPTGKANGRGAYLCARRGCWSRAVEGDAIERSLKVEVDSTIKKDLWEYARTHFPPDEELDDS